MNTAGREVTIRQRSEMAVEQLEPRFLLSLDSPRQLNPGEPAAAAAPGVIELGPVAAATPSPVPFRVVSAESLVARSLGVHNAGGRGAGGEVQSTTATSLLGSTYLGPYPNQNPVPELDGTSHRPPAQLAGGPTLSGSSLMPPPAPTEVLYLKSNAWRFLRSGQGTAGEAGEEVEVAASETDPSELDREIVAGEAAEGEASAASVRQLVDTPGGLPPAAGGLARRLAEAGRGGFGQHGAASGPAVVSAGLAAGLIVPNILILGSPRFRRSRPLWRWRWKVQRRTSA